MFSSSWTAILEAYRVDEILRYDDQICLVKATTKYNRQPVHIKHYRNLKGFSPERTK